MVPGDLRRGAAHDPADADRRALGVADEAVLAGVAEAPAPHPHRALHAVERLDRLAGPGPPDDQPTAGQQREVVGVGGLAQLEHDVVRRVDHVVDRTHAGQEQPLGDPARRRAHGDVVEHRHGEAGAEVGATPPRRSPPPRPAARSGGGAGGSGTANGRPRRPARSRAMPVMHQASGRLPSTVMSKTMSGSSPSASMSGVPGVARRLVAQDQQAGAVVGEPELLPRAQHPVGDDAAQLAAGDLEAARAGWRPTGASGTRSPTAKLCAPHTISSGSAPGVDDDQPDLVGALDGRGSRAPG